MSQRPNRPPGKASRNRGLPTAPSFLRRKTADWFRLVTQTFDLEPHHVKLLTMACSAWDDYEKAQEILRTKGFTFETSHGQPRARPEVAISRDSRISFARIIREIGFDLCDPDDHRPPRQSSTGTRRR